MIAEEKQEDFSFKHYFIPFTTTKAIHFLVLISLIIFCNGLFNPFVGDDFQQIVSNPQIYSLGNIGSYFLGSTFFSHTGSQLAGVYYKPLLVTTFSIIYALFGMHPFGFHLIQLVLHTVNIILLFFLLKHFVKQTTAFFLALIFLLHPINSQSVFYIAALQEPLFFFFGIIGLLILINHKSVRSFSIALFFFFLSLLSKETGVLFLLTSLCYTFLYQKKSFFLYLTGSLLVIIVYAFLRIHAVGFLGNPHDTPIDDLPFVTRLLNIPAIILYYLQTFVYPVQLSLTNNWSYTSFTFTNFFIPLFIELTFLLGDVSFGLYLFKQGKKSYFNAYLLFNALLFFGLLLHSQIIPLDMVVCAAWFYFPFVGLLGISGIVYEVFFLKSNKTIFLTIFVVILIALGIRTMMRSGEFRNEIGLYTQDLLVNPDNYAAEENIANDLYTKGQIEKAQTLVTESIDRYPRASSYNLLGLIYFEKGEYKQAREAYLNGFKRGSFQLQYDAMAQLGMVYGKREDNIHFIEYSLERFPTDPMLWQFLAIEDYQNGDKEDAKKAIMQAIRLNNSDQFLLTYYKIVNNKPITLDFKNTNY